MSGSGWWLQVGAGDDADLVQGVAPEPVPPELIRWWQRDGWRMSRFLGVITLRGYRCRRYWRAHPMTVRSCPVDEFMDQLNGEESCG